ncbi:MAG: nucleotide exchange factor GrpE [Ignavibacteriales bacterium]|nr:nucleotide exchange factor GrpE [Ignavibacteriales bacterium]
MQDDDIKEPEPEFSEPSNPEAQSQLSDLSEVDLLNAKLADLEKNLNQYKDQLLRKVADFENYKKRIENDYVNLVKFANEELLEKLLPVLDDFERSLKVKKSEDSTVDNESIIKGVELIFSKFKRILELQGVKSMEVIGQPFDPHLHDALLQIQTEEYPPHTVIQEVEKGYMLHDKVLRHAKVIVSADSQSGVEPIQKNNISETD